MPYCHRYGGGLIKDIKGTKRILMSASPELTSSFTGFADNVNNAINNTISTDNDINGLISIFEIFTNAANNNTYSFYKYEDNEDGIYSECPLPKNGDGNYGKIVNISDKYFCPPNAVRTLSGTLTGVYKIEGAGTSISSSEKITGNSRIKYYSAGTVELTAGFEIQAGSELEINYLPKSANCQ